MSLGEITVLDDDKDARLAKLWVPKNSSPIEVMIAMREQGVDMIGRFKVEGAEDFPEHSVIVVKY